MLLDKVSDTSLADLFLGLGDFSISKKKKKRFPVLSHVALQLFLSLVFYL